MISTLRFYRSQGGFDDRGQPLPTAHYSRTEVSKYVEYGLTPRFTVGAEPRYQKASAGVGSFQAKGSGLGDLDIFVRRSLFKYGPWVTSVQGLVKLPMYDRAENPARGNGRREYEMRVGAGRNIVIWMPGFVDGELAYRRGTKGLADQLRVEGTMGVRPSQRLTVLVKGLRTKSHDLGDGLPGSAYDLDKAEVSAVLRLSRSLSGEIGVSRDLSGERVGLGHALIASLWVRF
ncbi:MAG: hypothetical protein U1E87_00180 [Alphaproteobacteria bacterium]